MAAARAEDKPATSGTAVCATALEQCWPQVAWPLTRGWAVGPNPALRRSIMPAQRACRAAMPPLPCEATGRALASRIFVRAQTRRLLTGPRQPRRRGRWQAGALHATLDGPGRREGAVQRDGQCDNWGTGMVEMKPGETACCPHCGVTVRRLHAYALQYSHGGQYPNLDAICLNGANLVIPVHSRPNPRKSGQTGPLPCVRAAGLSVLYIIPRIAPCVLCASVPLWSSSLTPNVPITKAAKPGRAKLAVLATFAPDAGKRDVMGRAARWVDHLAPAQAVFTRRAACRFSAGRHRAAAPAPSICRRKCPRPAAARDSVPAADRTS